MTARPTVLYLLSASRSGSTLLERLLARMPSTTAAGELVHLWTRGLRDDEPCGCGLAFSSCPHWVQVGKEAFGGWEELDATRAIGLQRAVDRQRYIPSLLRPTGRAEQVITRYAARLSRLYRSITEVTGAEVVIDSSKHVSTALLLRHVPDVDVRIVHLVRDPRGVVSSWARETPRPEVEGERLHRVSHPEATARWAGRNLQAEAVARLLPTHRLRYEDLVRAPDDAIAALARDCGLAVPSGAIAPGGRARLETDHTVAGNPMRFRTGDIDLRLDERWRDDLTPAQRRGISAATWPLRRTYHYDDRS